MPSIDVPPEVWSRIFSFVAPPLPYVGMEHESFAEDAKSWRGDDDVRGQWKGIDALMLVSKLINELACPFFWSYLVLRSRARASSLILQLFTRPSSEQAAVRKSVKVVRFPGDLDHEKGEHPCLFVLSRFNEVVHVHLDSEPDVPTSYPVLISLASRPSDLYTPLLGLTGVVLGRSNFDAVTIMLRQLAPSLQHLSIYNLDPLRPSIFTRVNIKRQKMLFPCLLHLETGPFVDPDSDEVVHELGEAWLEDALDVRWDLPVLAKVCTLGVVGLESSYLGDSKSYDSLFLPTLAQAGRRFSKLATLKPRELGFHIGKDADDAEVDADVFASNVRQAGEPQVGSVKIIVVVEDPYPRSLEDGYDRCLVELVNRYRFPSLEKVVWVSSAKNDDGTDWSALLVKWILTLKDSGVKFEIQ